MTKATYSLLLAFCFICFTPTTFGGTNEIKIRYIGNCGLHITDGTHHIYSDFPYKSGAYNYAEYDVAELDKLEANSYYLFTHKHADHYSRKLLKATLKKKKGRAFRPSNTKDLTVLETALNDFKIEAFNTKHRYSFNHCSYLITWHNKKIFLSGDTEHAETLGEITDIDWAFIPSWLAIDANEKNIKINAKRIGIYHISPHYDVNITGEKVVMLKKQGEVFSIPY